MSTIVDKTQWQHLQLVYKKYIMSTIVDSIKFDFL